MHTDPIKNSWTPLNLKRSLAQCQADVGLYLTGFAKLRFKLVAILFDVSTRGAQRRLDNEIQSGNCNARAEGIKRLYLGGRQSVALHNHFPIALNLRPAAERGSAFNDPMYLTDYCLDVAAWVIEALSSMSANGSAIATTLATTRQPATLCDRLIEPINPQHFAVLYQGQVFRVNLLEDNKAATHKNILKQISEYSIENPSKQTISLGNLSVLARANWCKINASIKASPVVKDALETLTGAAFLICLDSKTQPGNLDALGKVIRFGNLDNRFFDKCLQFIIFGNGQVGMLCDHSVIDGVEGMSIAQEVSLLAERSRLKNSSDVKESSKCSWRPMPYELSSAITSNCLDTFIQQLAKTSSLSVKFEQFNSVFVRSLRLPLDSLGTRRISIGLRVRVENGMDWLATITQGIAELCPMCRGGQDARFRRTRTGHGFAGKLRRCKSQVRHLA
jgi:Choline/Carnitine o-acyltransferase